MNEAAKYFESNVAGSSVNVANNLIRSKKETSLLEAKLEILGLKKLDTDCVTVEKEDSYGNRYITDSVRISADEIKLLMSRSGGRISSGKEKSSAKNDEGDRSGSRKPVPAGF